MPFWLPLLGALKAAGTAVAASSLTAPLLSLGGTLVGAAADNKARKDANYMNSPQGIRENAEAAGFNPLLFVGPGTGTGAQFAPTMGHTIASGLAAVGDQFQEVDRLRIQRQQLEQENERLTDLTRRQTLQPATAGIYGAATSRAAPTGAETIMISGQQITRDPNFSDTETIETRYGEPVSWGYGAAVAGADTFQHVTGHSIVDIPGPNQLGAGVNRFLRWTPSIRTPLTFPPAQSARTTPEHREFMRLNYPTAYD